MAVLWKMIVPAGALSVAFTLTSAPAMAFFPPVPQPGEVITVVPPTPQPPIVVPPVTQPPVVCKPPVTPTHCGCDNPGGPQTVPEPGTLLLAGSGIALAAGWMRKRKTV